MGSRRLPVARITALNKAWGMWNSGSRLAGMAMLVSAMWSVAVLAAPDCNKAMAPQRCASYRQGWLSCNDMAEGARRSCIEQYTPALSCKRSRDARHCEALQAAQTACDGSEGQARRSCVREQLPAPDCSRATSKARCEQRAAAELNCAENAGQQRRECVRKALIPVPAALPAGH
jgi:hypothetical protein